MTVTDINYYSVYSLSMMKILKYEISVLFVLVLKLNISGFENTNVI